MEESKTNDRKPTETWFDTEALIKRAPTMFWGQCNSWGI